MAQVLISIIYHHPPRIPIFGIMRSLFLTIRSLVMEIVAGMMSIMHLEVYLRPCQITFNEVRH
jgi:hypothetical protein